MDPDPAIDDDLEAHDWDSHDCSEDVRWLAQKSHMVSKINIIVTKFIPL